MAGVTTEEPDLKSTAENLAGHVSEYVETYIQLTALKATQKATEVATISFTAVLISFFGMIIMIFAGLGLAALVSETYTVKEGYFFVSLVYIAIGIIVFAFRRALIFPLLRNQIVSKMYGNQN